METMFANTISELKARDKEIIILLGGVQVSAKVVGFFEDCVDLDLTNGGNVRMHYTQLVILYTP